MYCSTCIEFSGRQNFQCDECNTCLLQCSGNSKSATKFIQTNLSLPISTIQPSCWTQQQSGLSKEEPFCLALPKLLFPEIETQSRLSAEHLSLKASEEQIFKNKQGIESKIAAPHALAHKQQFGSDAKHMKSLLVDSTSVRKSVSLINFSEVSHNRKSFNADENNKFFNDSFIEYKHRAKTGDIFSFQDASDSNRSIIVNLSETPFVGTEYSLTNLYINSKPLVSSNKAEEQISLTTKALQDFDSQNSSNSRDSVKNYIQYCSPTSFCQLAALPCQHPHCHFCQPARKQELKKTMKTVSVSTESAPSLQLTCLAAPEIKLESELKPQKFLIMQATDGSPSTQTLKMIFNKSSDKPCMDVRMQKLLATIKEDAKITKHDERSQLIMIPAQVPAKEGAKKQVERISLKKVDKNWELAEQLINTHRSYYNPPSALIVPANNSHLLSQLQPAQQEPPLPQFQTLPCPAALVRELLKQMHFVVNIWPISACTLNIPRSPIKCPESTCQRMIFVSDFSKHLVVDHIHLPMERITRFQCKNFFLDARLFCWNATTCHLLYLLHDKITDLGSSEYKDFLPVLIMTSRIYLHQMCGLSSSTAIVEYFLIWITGIVPEDFPISVSLTVWSRFGRVPLCHVVYSGQMYSIRNSQNALDVWQSGRVLLLSSQEIDALTNNRKEMLSLQLSVH